MLISSLSSIGMNVSVSGFNKPVAYMIFGLHGDKEITSSFLIPSMRPTCILMSVVAVAVIARTFTLLGNRLRISPILDKASRNVEPLYRNL